MDAGVELSATTSNGNGIRRYSDGIYPVVPAPSLSSSSSPPLLPSSAAAAAAAGGGRRSRLSCSWIFCTTLKLCNTVAVTILAVLVVYIFLQLQYVNYQIAAQAQRLDDLVNQVTTQQSSEIAQLNQKVDSNHSLTLYQMAGTFGLLTWLITIFHMTSHIRNWHAPIVQRKIVTILWMPPIYGTTAFLSLVFPVANGYLAVISDFYEAYVIYTFLAFLIAVLGRGNRQVVVNVLAQHASHLAKPTRCLSSCYHPPPASSPQAKANAVLLECQVLCMQFVFLRPLTSIARFVATTLAENHAHEQQQLQAFAYSSSSGNSSSISSTPGDDGAGTRSMMTNYTDYDADHTATTSSDIADGDAITSSMTNSSSGGGGGYVYGGNAVAVDDDQWAYFKSPNFYIAMITNVSVFFAFSGLLKFYHAVNQELQWLNPFQKFMAIKGVRTL
jgi:Organic solute transporter Ostalpha